MSVSAAGIKRLFELRHLLDEPQDLLVEGRRIQVRGRILPALVLRPKEAPREHRPGVLWIHGGGYMLDMKEMVFSSRAADLVRRFGVTVVSPGYRLAFQAPYPAAIDDCYRALLFMKDHAPELNIRTDQIMVGGESAGGGLAAALCMMARDRREVSIAYQMPLYHMLGNFETESSRNNRGKVWNTQRNRLGWALYLRGNAKLKVSPYAAAAHQTNYRGLPPAYTFVGDGEPFLCETLAYIDNLKQAGIEAEADVFPTDIHAFDMLCPELDISVQARERFIKHFEHALSSYHAPQAF